MGRESGPIHWFFLSLGKTYSMFLALAHTKLDVFAVSKSFVLTCYKETKSFPSEEKFGMISKIRKAALSVHPDAAEGSSRKSAVDLEYTSKHRLEEPGKLMIRSFQMISKMIS